MMKVTIVTLFKEVFDGFFSSSIPKRAIDKKILEVEFINPRDFTYDKYHKCDDIPYGGGAGMILKPEPLFAAIRSIEKTYNKIIYPTPSGRVFKQEDAYLLSKENHIVFIAGHYEGIDQRVIDTFVTDEFTIGDYVLSSGESAILVMIDAIYRLIDGVITKESLEEESFSNGLLEYPQYTHPRIYENLEVPSVLLSGNHKLIREWRYKKSIEKTKLNRIELIKNIK